MPYNPLSAHATCFFDLTLPLCGAEKKKSDAAIRMSWKKTDLLVKKRLNQHGLGVLVEAGVLCQKAEELLPGVFKAVSVRNAALHLELTKENLLAFKMVEGQLMHDLNQFASTKKLPGIKRIRLTFREDPLY
jgi:hypothetical protein